MSNSFYFIDIQIPKDAHILRFLRAREFNVEKAREMVVHSLAWRKLHNIDKILDSYKPSETLETYYPGGWHFCDNGNFCGLNLI